MSSLSSVLTYKLRTCSLKYVKSAKASTDVPTTVSPNPLISTYLTDSYVRFLNSSHNAVDG